ncbi:hypothetical protein [Catenovulum maritimum]|uniref:PEP-CTERM protein-sorting domain-containing protein n=1 Tax=Catenovulum maritimum TaxID=1513271 RepID=A0A0J8GYI2_9ALTE|nr:hypothetical protein [Catenovulum maritimum]KMT66294.1 hypothetical protein XM47_04700 [Catenovulum maritimum]
MMLKKISKSFLASAILGLSFQASAWEWTMDFDKYYDNSGNEQYIKSGQIIDDEYSSGYVFDEVSGQVVNVGVGATITVENPNSDDDIAVAFNTGADIAGEATSHDSDLKAAFNHYQTGSANQYNASGERDNILIIQEDGSTGTCGSEYCTDVDDEGSQPGGQVFIAFNSLVTLESINFFDIEEKPTFITAYNDDANTSKVFTVPEMGNNNWGAIDLTQYAANRIAIYLGGSGAFSDLKLSKIATQVSEPHTILVLIMGLGLIAYRRKSLI